jgi:hypothetical protein
MAPVWAFLCQLLAGDGWVTSHWGNWPSDSPPLKNFSGSVVQRISGGRRSHGGAEARHTQREETTTRHKGNWRVPCSCLCVETPVVARMCFALPPRSSILYGCINFPGRQVNAVWGRCPTACAIYVKNTLEFIGGSSTKSLPPSS